MYQILRRRAGLSHQPCCLRKRFRRSQPFSENRGSIPKIQVPRPQPRASLVSRPFKGWQSRACCANPVPHTCQRRWDLTWGSQGATREEETLPGTRLPRRYCHTGPVTLSLSLQPRDSTFLHRKNHIPTVFLCTRLPSQLTSLCFFFPIPPRSPSPRCDKQRALQAGVGAAGVGGADKLSCVDFPSPWVKDGEALGQE